MKGVPPGGFMTAVLANDLMEAAGRADASNARALIGWATFLYNYAPSSCKGSYEAVERWINTGGLEGIRRAAEGGEGEGEGSGANRPAKAPAKPEPGMLTQEQIDDIWDDANG